MTKPAVSCPRVPPPSISQPLLHCAGWRRRGQHCCAPRGFGMGSLGGAEELLGSAPAPAGEQLVLWEPAQRAGNGVGVFSAPVRAPGALGRRGGSCSQQVRLCSFGVGRTSLPPGLWAVAGGGPAGTGIGGWGQPEVTCGVFVCPSLQHRRCRAGLAGMGTRQHPGASSSPVPMQLGQLGGPKLAPTSPQAQAAQTPSAREQSELGAGQKHPGVGQGPGRAAPAPQNPPHPTARTEGGE